MCLHEHKQTAHNKYKTHPYELNEEDLHRNCMCIPEIAITNVYTCNSGSSF